MIARWFVASLLFAGTLQPTLAAKKSVDAPEFGKVGAAIGEPEPKVAAELERRHRYEGVSQVHVIEVDQALERIAVRLRAGLGWPAESPRVRMHDCSGYVATTRAYDDVRICRDVIFTARTEDEVAWLIAHEFGHLARRDKDRLAAGLSSPNSAGKMAGNLVIIAGMIVAPPLILAGPAVYGRTETVLVKEAGRRSKQEELDADRFAFNLIARVGYNPLSGVRALTCMDAQTLDCSPPTEIDIASVPQAKSTADKALEALLPSGWIRSYSHPTIGERVKQAAVIIPTLTIKPVTFKPLGAEFTIGGMVDYRRRLSLVDALGGRAANIFAQALRVPSPTSARTAMCQKQHLTTEARKLLQGQFGRDRSIRSAIQAVGIVCGDDELVQAGAEFGDGSSYAGDLTAFIWRARGRVLSPADAGLMHIVQRYGDDERQYRELRWIPALVSSNIANSPEVREACKASPYLRQRYSRPFMIDSFCSIISLYAPEFSSVDWNLQYWFDPAAASRRETLSWAPMLLRANFELLCIVQSGYAIAGKPTAPPFSMAVR